MKHKHPLCSYCPSTPTHWSLSADNVIIYACLNHHQKLITDAAHFAGIFQCGTMRERAIRAGFHPEIKGSSA